MSIDTQARPGNIQPMVGDVLVAQKRLKVWLLVCFTVSGMSGLIYEVAWVRSLELIFGATTFAVATVLAAFMGGLALGSYFMGLSAHRLARLHPLRLYAIIEFLIGLAGFSIPFLFQGLVPFYQWVWREFQASFVWFSLLRLLLCFGILAVPTFLMGATLPLLSNFAAQISREKDRLIGFLYASNTLGAVLGCLGAGVLFFPEIGLLGTQYLAVGLNLAAGLGGLWLAGKASMPRVEFEPEAVANSSGRLESVPSFDPPAQKSDHALLLATYAISGFCAMLYEVAWTRVLVLVLGSSTYAYTIMLTTFLLGLALGAVVGSRQPARSVSPLMIAGFCQLFVGLATYLGVFLVEELPFLYVSAFAWFHPGATGLLMVQFLLAMGLMILPTIGLGAMFPIVIRGLNPSGARTARLVGWAYALNTLGAIAGSILAGFWLVPRLGSQSTFLIGIALNSLFGLMAIWAIRLGVLARFRMILGLLIVCFIIHLFLGTPRWHPHILSSGIFRYVKNYEGQNRQTFLRKLRENRGQILYFDEGLTCTVTVCRSLSSLSLLVNGKPDASTPSGFSRRAEVDPTRRWGDLPTQILLGEIPLMLAPGMEDVLVIGLGSGVTLGSVLRHPAKLVECVELEGSVVEASRFFNGVSDRPLADPRVRLIVNDARNHLLVSERRYDVMISEPSNPWIAGAASLFTREFFEIARSKLRPGGAFCQWIQLYELQPEDFYTILRSFTSVFRDVHLFKVEDDAIVVGFVGSGAIELEQLRGRWNRRVAEDLIRIEIQSPQELLAHYWIGGRELLDNIPAGPGNTDDNMRIEFAAPLRLLTRHDQQRAQATLLQLFEGRSTGLISHLELSDRDLLTKAARWAGMAEAALSRRLSREALLYAGHSLKLARNPAAGSAYGQALSLTGKHEQARDWWTQMGVEFPEDAGILRARARFHLQEQNWGAASRLANRLLEQVSDDLEGSFILGKSLFYLKEGASAIQALEKVAADSSSGDRFPEAAFLLGSLYWRTGQFELACRQLGLALERNRDDIEAASLLADTLARLGREHEARWHWQRIGKIYSEQARVRLEQGKTQWNAGRYRRAHADFTEAWQHDPWDDEIVFYLSRSRAELGDLQGSIQLLQEYLEWNPDRPWPIGYLSQLVARQGDQTRAQELADYYHALTGQAWQILPIR